MINVTMQWFPSSSLIKNKTKQIKTERKNGSCSNIEFGSYTLNKSKTKKFMSKTGQRGSIRRVAFNGLARTLGGVPLGAMERFARRKGGEHERVLEKVKANYW